MAPGVSLKPALSQPQCQEGEGENVEVLQCLEGMTMDAPNMGRTLNSNSFSPCPCQDTGTL